MIRLAKESDILGIMSCINDAKAFLKASGSTQWNGPDSYPDTNTLINDINNKNCYVCIRDNTVCGVAVFAGLEPEYNSPTAYWLTNEDRYTTIHRVAVLDSYRGQGVAKELFKYAEEYAKNIGNISVRIDTHPKNIVMQSLVKTLGYQYCGEMEYSRILVEPLRLVYEKKI